MLQFPEHSLLSWRGVQQMACKSQGKCFLAAAFWSAQHYSMWQSSFALHLHQALYTLLLANNLVEWHLTYMYNWMQIY